MRWNRIRFHLISFARNRGACCSRHDEGRLFVGAACAVEVWRRTPGDGWLGWLVGLPVMRQVARFAYDRFADLLYAWNRRKGHW